MKVNEWTQTLWEVLNVRPKTLHDYKRLYRRHLEPLMGNLEIDQVLRVELQRKLLSLPNSNLQLASRQRDRVT